MDQVTYPIPLLCVIVTLWCYVTSSIQGDFPNEPIMWDALARRQWNEVDTSLLSGNHSNDRMIS